ncbi:hypothetical protein DW66_3489 [Pseudomonas putida]|nr:hypothetical protein DW66_3489 [Pseudomonas putida]
MHAEPPLDRDLASSSADHVFRGRRQQVGRFRAPNRKFLKVPGYHLFSCSGAA